MNLIKWGIIGLIIAGSLVQPALIKATCTITASGGPSSCSGAGCDDWCVSSGGGASGVAYFGCGEYCFLRDADNNCVSYGQACYYNVYSCDTSCGGSTVPGCFVPGTLVGNKSEGKKIEDVKVGDVVTSFKDDKIVESTVSQIFKVTRDYYYKLVAGDYEVEVTAEHPFYIGNDKFEETQNLKVGDTLYVDEDGEMIPKTISSLTRVDEPTDAYNMTVDNTNTYFANGFAVHNKVGNRTYTYGPSCGPTEVRSSTIVGVNRGGQCGKGINWVTGTFYQLGSAELSGSCCELTTTEPSVCGDFYCCRWNQYNQCDKTCRDCTDEVIECTGWDVVEYQCIPTCNNVNPASPYKTSPANGATLATTSVGLAWNEPTSWGISCNGGLRSYFVRVSTSPTLSSNNTDYVLGDSVRTQLFPAVNGTTYYWSVAAVNGALDSNATNTINSFTIQSTIGGRVYDVDNNVCPGGVGTNFGGLNVAIGATNAPVDANGVYSAVVEDGLYNVSVGIPTGYSCANGTGCAAYPCTKTGVLPGTTGLNFYLSSNKVMWWQAEGAGIYAGSNVGSTTIRSTIPASILTNRYLVLANTGGTAAAVLRASGTAPTATSGTLGVGTVNADEWSAKTTYKGKRADYNYFKNEMGLLSTTTSETNLNSKPAAGPAFHYMEDASAITNPWNVLGNEKYVIFVNGDLNINANVTVAPGGFLAFVVKGNIIVDSSVTEIHGLFVSDGDFNTLSAGTDTQLTVEGSVVAWGNVNLARDLVGDNSNTPAELFVYRTDLLTAMPDEMKSFVMQWSEVVPGTYEEQ